MPTKRISNAKIPLNGDQVSALKYALADLQGAIEVHEANDPFVQLDPEAVQQTIKELKNAFPFLKQI